MAWLELSGCVMTYVLPDGSEMRALDGAHLSAERGEFVSVVGRSGSGKTTMLRVVAGLAQPTAGSLRFDGVEPRIGIVFQEPRLMPWLTVRKNILFPFLGDRAALAAKKKTADELIAMLGLSDFADAYPHQLSGGMAQRAALGRALCWDPELILMDEPLGALDWFTRGAMQREIAALHQAHGKTIVFVTHDVEEALLLSDRIAVLDQGRTVREFSVDLPRPRRRSDRAFCDKFDEIVASL